MSWYFDLLEKKARAKQMGMLSAQRMFEPDPQERFNTVTELLGQNAKPAQIGELGELGQFSLPLSTAQEGTGYLGGDKGTPDQAKLYSGLLSAGYSKPEASGMLNLLSGDKQKPTTLMQNLSAAGVDLQSAEGQQTMLDAVMKPQTQVSFGGMAGSMWTPKQVESAGLPKDTVVTTDRYGKPQILNKEKYSQPQILSGGFATRMHTATNTFKELMDGGFDPSGVIQNIDAFGMPDVAANYMRSSEGQQYRQAQENWITANLRKESGAAIPPEETDREIKKWFPQPGDTPATIAKKSQSRKDAQRAMEKSAGGSYQELLDQAESDRLSELRSKHGAN